MPVPEKRNGGAFQLGIVHSFKLQHGGRFSSKLRPPRSCSVGATQSRVPAPDPATHHRVLARSRPRARRPMAGFWPLPSEKFTRSGNTAGCAPLASKRSPPGADWIRRGLAGPRLASAWFCGFRLVSAWFRRCRNGFVLVSRIGLWICMVFFAGRANGTGCRGRE